MAGVCTLSFLFPNTNPLLHSSGIRTMTDCEEAADPDPKSGDGGDPVPRSELADFALT